MHLKCIKGFVVSLSWQGGLPLFLSLSLFLSNSYASTMLASPWPMLSLAPLLAGSAPK